MKINGTNIYMTRGDTEYLMVTCPARPFADGDIVELTVRQFEGFGDALIHKVVTAFSDGRALIALRPEDTAGLGYCTASYDIQVTFADLGVKTVVKPSKFVIGRENSYAK